MPETAQDLLETILRQCEAAAPEPWYPKLYAESNAVPRDSLDAPLEKLRLGGLIRLTEWVQGRGQGYVLTPEGQHALQNGRELARMRDGKPLRRPEPVERKPRVLRAETAWDRGEAVREVFLDPPNSIVTKSLLFANVLVFVAGYYLATQQKVDINQFLAGSNENGSMPIAVWNILHATGALEIRDIARGGWGWVRLLTSAFVHIGFMHILMNGVALYFLGRLAEPMYGHGRYLVLYLLSAFGGGCGMLMGTAGGGAGASGAVCGLLAAIGVWFLLNRPYMPPELASRGLRNIALNAMLIIIISFAPGVSLGGHVGGAIAGAAAAVLLHYQRHGAGAVRWVALAALPLVPVASVAALTQGLNMNPRWVKLREEAREKQIANERQELRERYKREALDDDEEARSSYNRAYNAVLKVHPERRDTDKKQQAVFELRRAQLGLRLASERLSAGPQPNDPEVEEAHKGVLEYLEVLRQICLLAESYLRRDTGLTGPDKVELESLETRLKELQDRWAKYLQ
jgi:membrane associated rhomboid family serine protease